MADLGSPAEEGRLLHRDEVEGGRGAAGKPPNLSFEPGPRGLLALVADGMGGAAAGELASRTATSTIHEVLGSANSIEPAATGDAGADLHAALLREAVLAANDRLLELAEENLRLAGMGTTATVATIIGDTLRIAQIGDSRCYLVRGGTAHQLTHDQSRVQALIDSGLMTPEEAARSSQRHIILQALGPDPDIQVVLTHRHLRRGDVVVLTTDGLHELVSPAEIARIAAPHQSARGARPRESGEHDPAAACRALIELANERGGPDNITVVIIHIDGDDIPEPGPGDLPEGE